MSQDSKNRMLKLAARRSPLSKIQVEEVCDELNLHIQGLEYDIRFLQTKGDCDLQTSLKDLEKTNFFTDAVDRLVITGQVDVGIHSAKDLPEPLPRGLEIFALTKGLDSSDVLVLRQDMTLADLPKNPRIGTSSARREKAALNLLPNTRCIDIRGVIGERLRQLDESEVDGVIMARCALIRLGLHHRTMLPIEAEVSPLQGRLAIVGRQGDLATKEIFSLIDARAKAPVAH